MKRKKLIVNEKPDCRCLWIINKGSILAKIGNATEIAKSLGLEEEFDYDELNVIAKDIMKCEARIISTEEFIDLYKKLISKGKSIIVI